nr:HAD-IA family hydrolase [Bacteroidia bacterium]
EIWGPQCADMFELMERTWFSFDLGKRKPNRDIYDFVVDAMGMNVAETLFLDDSRANIEGAAASGWQTGWINSADNAHFESYCLELLNKV